MNHSHQRAVVVGIAAAITPLIFQVISVHAFAGTHGIILDFFLAVSLGFLSFTITYLFPIFHKRKNSFSGLYFIIYTDVQDHLCSVINIEFKGGTYLIDVYDFKYQQGSNRWVAVQSAPRGHSNVYFDKNPRELHTCSHDETLKSCIFFNFYNAQGAASITRFGCNAPFDRHRTGQLFKLSRTDLCCAYNSSFKDHLFCNKKQDTIDVCIALERSRCHQSESKILLYVRKKNAYIEIPRELYGTSE